MSYSLSKKFTFHSLLAFALPTTLMMIVMSLYTIVDGIFVSRFVGTNALSAINIAYPAINIVLGIAVMFSNGSNAIIARKLGEGKSKDARSIFSAVIGLNLIIGFTISLFGNLFAVWLAQVLGASDLILEDCVTYLRWLLGFAPALMLQIQFQMFFVTEGRPGIGLTLILMAGFANVVLDYLLIVPLQMGIAGAAIATITGYMIPSIIGMIYFSRIGKTLHLIRPHITISEFGETCLNGSSEMVTNLSTGITTFLFNLLMMHYAGENGVAAITIIQYSQFLLNALFMGFSQGVAPVISYNYGSQNHRQLKQVFRISLAFIITTSIGIFLLAQLTGNIIVGIFAKPDSKVYELAVHGFLLFAFSFLFSGLNIFTSAFFTALGNGKISAIISFVRTFGLILASLAVLPLILGIDGVWIAIPIAEIGSSILCIGYIQKNKTVYQYG